MVDEVLVGAKEAGALIEKIILNKLTINPCQACNSCYKTGDCMHDDDMSTLLDKMEKSNVWILGTPIYWWGPTAQFKAFLDRWYHPKHKEFKGKSIILVIPLGGGHERYARHTVGMLTDVLDYLSMELFTTILAPSMNERGAVRKRVRLLERARDTGREVVKSKYQINHKDIT